MMMLYPHIMDLSINVLQILNEYLVLFNIFVEIHPILLIIYLLFYIIKEKIILMANLLFNMHILLYYLRHIRWGNLFILLNLSIMDHLILIIYQIHNPIVIELLNFIFLLITIHLYLFDLLSMSLLLSLLTTFLISMNINMKMNMRMKV